MAKTERFEMRLDEASAAAIDAWRDANMAGASRAQAVRALIERGLAGAAGGGPRFSDGEKTLMAFMGDLFRHLGAPAERVDAVCRGFATGNHWAADLELGGLYSPASSSASPDDARFVLSVLEMWEVFESAFEDFSEAQRAQVLGEGEGAQRRARGGRRAAEPRFAGFDAVHEPELLRIAEFLVREMRRFERFAGRSLVAAQGGSRRDHEARLRYYERLLPTLAGRRPTPDEVREFLGLRVQASGGTQEAAGRGVSHVKEFSFHRFGLLAPRVNALSRVLTRSAVQFAKAEYGLSQVEWLAVTLLGAFQPVSIGELAYHAMLDAGQMSRTVSGLVERGFVGRRRSDEDSRETVLTLTVEGEGMRRRLAEAAAARNRHVVGDLPESELAIVYARLDGFIARARQLVD
ncbi:MarR family transcriptional regulator [Pigmentiphaga sp. D-2]|uniref:MarR family transcriptional regulator n=1 Tax=Pigmentiphaga sp. D-2 TaxID=1002116 RepID=UPI00104C3B7D|nr:MarR family transcriptional regulator [Pigmentiphaga sp. D-2]